MSGQAETICPHFGTCGGCAYQDLPPDRYIALKQRAVSDALAREGLSPRVAEMVAVPPFTRRRAAFKVARRDGKTHLGFHAAQSHTIVDMHACRVLTAGLLHLVPALREMMGSLLKEGEDAELHITEADNGFDVALHGIRFDAARTAAAAGWASKLGLCRITCGREIVVAFEDPQIAFGRAAVRLPSETFLQPTREGERALQDLVLQATTGAKRIADLFCGAGTFALRLAEAARIFAVDADAAALEALAAAARSTQGLKPVSILRRDLFRSPLGIAELAQYDAVVLDPPRAGAGRQVRELARSKVPCVVYVSCNPTSFARDAGVLVEGGYRLGTVVPVDQFLWSSHIELVADFSRV